MRWQWLCDLFATPFFLFWKLIASDTAKPPKQEEVVVVCLQSRCYRSFCFLGSTQETYLVFLLVTCPFNGKSFTAWCLVMLQMEAMLKTRILPYLLARKRHPLKDQDWQSCLLAFWLSRSSKMAPGYLHYVLGMALQPKQTIWKVGRCKSILFIGLAVCRSLQVSMNNVHAAGCIFSWNYIVKE